jgi:hypothetical protein
MVHLLAVLSLLVSCAGISTQGEVVKRLTAQPSRAEDFRLYRDGVGPLTVSSKIDVKNKVARVHATATNASGVLIRYALICIRPRDRKECAVLLWNTALWQPGEMIAWDKTLQVRTNWQQYEMEVAQLVRDSKIYHVKKVYVDLIEGNGAGMSRDQLMALITNSSRFELVESPEKADAILKGRSESREAGSAYRSSGQNRSSGAGIGVLGSVAGTSALGGAFGEARSEAAAEGVTQMIVAEALVLRLTLASGESIWAWDDTKPCAGAKPKCAIDDLAFAAAPPFVPAQ